MMIPVWIIFVVINIALLYMLYQYVRANGGGDFDFFSPLFGCGGTIIITLMVWVVYFAMKSEGVF